MRRDPLVEWEESWWYATATNAVRFSMRLLYIMRRDPLVEWEESWWYDRFLTSESGSGVFRSQAPVRVCSLPVQKPTTLLLSETTHDRNGAVRRIQCLCKSARNIYPFDPPVLPVSGHRSVFSMPSAKELSRQLIPQNSLILFAILPVLLLFALKIALILPFRYHLHILLFY